MKKKSKNWYNTYYGNTFSCNLRDAAKIYFNNAIRVYLKNEGKVSLYNDENLGDSANIICSTNRCIEHLLKLKLVKTDPVLLYPLPKKFEEYLKIKSIDPDKEMLKKDKNYFPSNTITYKEAIERVKFIVSSEKNYFKIFSEIYSLRNSIEHHWDRNIKFLEKNIGIMSSKIIPSIKAYILEVLNEDFEFYEEKILLEDVYRLDRAINEGHTLETQKRLEKHKDIYKHNPKLIERLEKYPKVYKDLDTFQLNEKCPICGDRFYVFWDFEVDYDEHGPIAAFPDPKCLYCEKCRFYIDKNDIGTYLPNGLEDYFDDIIQPDYDLDY